LPRSAKHRHRFALIALPPVLKVVAELPNHKYLAIASPENQGRSYILPASMLTRGAARDVDFGARNPRAACAIIQND